MAFLKLRFKPTFQRQTTAYAGEGFWRDGDLVRFRYGFPETIGGWIKQVSGIQGVCRALFAWNKLNGESLLGIGTHLKYYVERGTVLFDLTPIRRTVTLNNPFSTVNTTLATALTPGSTEIELTSSMNFPVSGRVKIGTEIIEYSSLTANTLIGLVRTTPMSHAAGTVVYSDNILVTDTAHGAFEENFVIISGAVGFSSFLADDLNKTFQIVQASMNTYNVNVGVFPTAAGSGGGTMVNIRYEELTGQAIQLTSSGWGSVPWSFGGFGGVGTASGEFRFQIRIWNHQNFGEDLIYGPRGGALYYWDSTNPLMPDGGTVRGVPLATYPGALAVPVEVNNLIITDSRFVMALGATPLGGGELDPMLIRWSDQELFYDWLPTPTNLAGDLRLSLGTSIIATVQTRQEILVWTDTALYSVQFNESVGFVPQVLATGVSIAGPNAVVASNNVVYWMGRDKFYVYTGRSDTLPCSVESYVFDRLNEDQTFQVYAGANEGFDEVWWFYPSENQLTTDSYVVFNYVDNAWYYGNMERTAWLDAGIRKKPLATNPWGMLVQHETGTVDGTVEPAAPLMSYIESSDFALGDGFEYMFVTRLLPDVDFSESSNMAPAVRMTIGLRKSTGAAYLNEVTNEDVYNMVGGDASVHTDKLYLRGRGRQAKFRVESLTLGTAWKLGDCRLDVKPNGKRS